MKITPSYVDISAEKKKTSIEKKKGLSAAEFSEAIFDSCRAADVQYVVMGGFLKHVRIPPDFQNRVFGDCDDGPTKKDILARRDAPELQKLFELCFAKRPAEELYDVRKDPHELINVAGQPEYAAERKRLRAQLDEWMKATGDPRAIHDDDHWDSFPYFGNASASKKAEK